jgi:hypothetical protein
MNRELVKDRKREATVGMPVPVILLASYFPKIA